MNLATNQMEKMTDMMRKTDARLKEMGKEPYGMRKLTEAEQMQQYRNLTPEKIFEMIETSMAMMLEIIYKMWKYSVRR